MNSQQKVNDHASNTNLISENNSEKLDPAKVKLPTKRNSLTI